MKKVKILGVFLYISILACGLEGKQDKMAESPIDTTIITEVKKRPRIPTSQKEPEKNAEKEKKPKIKEKEIREEKQPKKLSKKELFINNTLQIVNTYRKMGYQCGANYYPPAEPVKWNDLLEMAAFQHSDDMRRRDYFSHSGSDGSRAGDRIKSVGYLWKVYGENIAEGYDSEKEVIDDWMESPSHCKNIMNPEFKEMAIGISGDFWTQNFATKLKSKQ